MWTSSKWAVGSAALLLPVAVLCGVVGTEPPPEPARPGGYTLRCWQDGRLILEEQHVSMPALAESGGRLQLVDRHQQPMVVAETRNATCLVRARPPERPKSALP